MIIRIFLIFICGIVYSVNVFSIIPDIKIIESSTYIQAEDNVYSDDGGGYNYYGFPIEYNGTQWTFSNQINSNHGKLVLNNDIYLHVSSDRLSNLDRTEASLIIGDKAFKIKSAILAKQGFSVSKFDVDSSRISLFTWEMIEYRPKESDYIQHIYLFVYDRKNNTLGLVDIVDPQVHANLDDFLGLRKICMFNEDDYWEMKNNILKFSCTQNQLKKGIPKKIDKTVVVVKLLDEQVDGKYFKVIESNYVFKEQLLK